MKKIVVVDYGMGNLRSVAQALRAVAPEAEVLISGEIADLKKAERIVLPGQGAMPDCMKSLEESGLKDALMDAARATNRYSESASANRCFLTGARKGTPKDSACCPARSSDSSSTASFRKTDRVTKFPKWDGIRSGKASHILCGMVLPTKSFFYFVHSFYAVPEQADHMVGETEYGTPFCSAIACDNIFATQFHPEKSADVGLQLYKNFIHWNP